MGSLCGKVEEEEEQADGNSSSTANPISGLTVSITYCGSCYKGFVAQLATSLTDKYGTAVNIVHDPRISSLPPDASDEQRAARAEDTAWWKGEPMGDFNYDPMLKTAMNKPYRLLVGDTVVYSRLTVDGTNFPDADDTNPSEEAVSEFGERGGRARFWGPIIPTEGNKFWGGRTPGKLQMVYDAIDEQLKSS